MQPPSNCSKLYSQFFWFFLPQLKRICSNSIRSFFTLTFEYVCSAPGTHPCTDPVPLSNYFNTNTEFCEFKNYLKHCVIANHSTLWRFNLSSKHFLNYNLILILIYEIEWKGQYNQNTNGWNITTQIQQAEVLIVRFSSECSISITFHRKP